VGLLIVVLIFVAVWAWRVGVPLFSTNKQARAEFLAQWWQFAKAELGAWAVSASLAYALTYPAKWPPFIYGLIFWGLGLLCSRIVIWLSALLFVGGYIYCATVFYTTGHPPFPPVWIFNGVGGVLAAIVIRHPLTWFLASPRTFADYEVTRIFFKALHSHQQPPPAPPPAHNTPEHNEQAPNHNR
jgi:hypothetical protein